jgi:ribosomal subunit interface protein
MKHPLQITVRNMSLSEAAKATIHEKAAKLDALDDRIIGCRVLVELPHKHHHQGALYNVRIDLTIPGAELVVKREPHEDLYVAIRDAFDAARRQLRERRKQTINGVVPREAPQPDGREIYFHRNAVLNGGFDHLEVGAHVRYVEEEGEKGPQASTVVSTTRHAAHPLPKGAGRP